MCANLSRSGAWVRASEPLSPGRRVLLELELPGGGRFEALGRVAWCRLENRGAEDGPSGMGVEFLGARAEHGAWLDRFLHRRLRGNGTPPPPTDSGPDRA